MPIIETLQVDKSREAFDNSDRSLSISSGGHATVNRLLSPNACKALPPKRSSQAQWISGYRARVSYPTGQLASSSSRRLRLITMDELDLDFLFRHLSRPKH